jgi:hypothetical protein
MSDNSVLYTAIYDDKESALADLYAFEGPHERAVRGGDAAPP